jgi:hypothetical protein
VLCLGTSLQIRPICNLPLRTKRAGGTFAIVNLQKTPKHSQAHLTVHAKCDDVMRQVMAHLDRPIPTFTRRDKLGMRFWASQEEEAEEVCLSQLPLAGAHTFCIGHL